MRIGVISDTHGNLINSTKAAEILKANQIEVVLHCGDIGSASVPIEFEEFETHYVFGNVDSEQSLLRHAIKDASGTCHDRFADLQLAGKKIALLHSDDPARFREAMTSGDYDLVCYGHTHKAEYQFVGSTLVLNPGALHRANPYSLAIVDLSDLAVEQIELPRQG